MDSNLLGGRSGPLIVHTPFQHTPLDLQTPSIRLIQILPSQSRSNVEHIRLDIRVAALDSEYLCLSYVWGKTSPGQWIFVDGRRMWIRQNLWDFLQAARRNNMIRRQCSG
ncbi:hypothetical protein FB567DRAFT_535091 [Paraphoma chrysanthemicola]|uniref:Heterokaryon incompatibility domain-containing protein n=1 Tax=Paraphoma chrysanthemicola TaxID=798071 RepID=A0A8K0R083_9PLEO|nr:hypothetical protein FB567DRAFT_535091 [Paraphoma chrysanthemicola]